jgi:hypothetical protein
MLVIDLYTLLPAFTLASFLLILLWPENIAYKTRLKLFMMILLIWVGASSLAMAGYGTMSENRTPFLVNVIVGCLGLVAVLIGYLTNSSRRS